VQPTQTLTRAPSALRSGNSSRSLSPLKVGIQSQPIVVGTGAGPMQFEAYAETHQVQTVGEVTIGSARSASPVRVPPIQLPTTPQAEPEKDERTIAFEKWLAQVKAAAPVDKTGGGLQMDHGSDSGESEVWGGQSDASEVPADYLDPPTRQVTPSLSPTGAASFASEGGITGALPQPSPASVKTVITVAPTGTGTTTTTTTQRGTAGFGASAVPPEVAELQRRVAERSREIQDIKIQAQALLAGNNARPVTVA